MDQKQTRRTRRGDGIDSLELVVVLVSFFGSRVTAGRDFGSEEKMTEPVNTRNEGNKNLCWHCAGRWEEAGISLRGYCRVANALVSFPFWRSISWEGNRSGGSRITATE